MTPVKNKIIKARLGTVLYKKGVRRKKITKKKTNTYTFD